MHARTAGCYLLLQPLLHTVYFLLPAAISVSTDRDAVCNGNNYGGQDLRRWRCGDAIATGSVHTSQGWLTIGETGKW